MREREKGEGEREREKGQRKVNELGREGKSERNGGGRRKVDGKEK